MVQVTCFIFPSACEFNTLNAELNPICHLLALLGAHHILHVSRIRVKAQLLLLCCSLLVKISLYYVVLTSAYFGSDRYITNSFPSQTLVTVPCSLTARFVFSKKSGMR
jgi:hypothetical protein